MKKFIIIAIAELLFLATDSIGQTVIVTHRPPCRVVVNARPVIVAPLAVAVIKPAPVVILPPRRIVYTRQVFVLR